MTTFKEHYETTINEAFNYSKESTELIGDESYKIWNNPTKAIPRLKSFIKNAEKIIKDMKLTKGDSYYVAITNGIKDAEHQLEIFNDIIPIVNKFKKGQTPSDIEKLIAKSKYYDYSKHSLMGDVAKIDGPMDLYVKFNDNETYEKYYF